MDKNNNANLIRLTKDIDSKKVKSSRKTFEEAQQKIDELIVLLTLNKMSFDSDLFKNELLEYLKVYHRVLYSEISVLIFQYYQNDENENIDNIIQNLTFLANDIDLSQEITDFDKTILKLTDHVMLANKQLSTLATTEEAVRPFIEKSSMNFNRSLNKQINKINNLKNEYKKNIDSKSKDILSQMIAITSIFVGISFVMFGGMTLLNGLFDFSNMETVPLNELLCLGSLMGIIMIAIIYTFMIFIFKLTDKNIDSQSLLNKILIAMIVILTIVCCFTYYDINTTKKQDNNENKNEIQENITNNQIENKPSNDQKNSEKK